LLTRHLLILATALAAVAAHDALAQTPPQAGQRAGRGAAMTMMDTNGDGRVTLDEFMGIMRQRFDAADVNHDGGLTPDELRLFLSPRGGRGGTVGAGAGTRQASPERQAAMFQRLDRNRDGRVTWDELEPVLQRRFQRRDTNGDGAFTPDEMATGRARGGAAGRQPPVPQ
jgi:Ca2+-binding EF-hand superfamily protein